MPNHLLVDAGPLVAILNQRDRDHATCVDFLKNCHRPLLSTWMPITEAMYLLDFSIAAQGALLEMIERGALKILDISARDVPAIHTLMEKYGDRPMDFADPTLVHVANREGVHDIFTLDTRDFGVYRLNQGQTFNMLPD